MFLLMNKYLRNALSSQYKHQPWAMDCGFDENFFTSQYYEDLVKFQDAYLEWLQELDENKRSFKPFDENRISPLFDLVNGQKAHKLFSPPDLWTSNYALMDSYLNSNWSEWNKTATKEQKFIELFYRATEELTLQKFNF